MLQKIYCVLNVRTDRRIYLGPSIEKAACQLEPGTIYGWGPDVVEAREDAGVRADGFRGWRPLVIVADEEAES